MADNEDKLIHQAQHGDARAFERLIAPYDRRLLNLAYDMVGNTEEAQDIFQEALLSAFKTLPRFQGRSSFFTWLYRIVINKALNFRQRHARTIPFSDGDGLAAEQIIAPPSDSPDQRRVASELRAENSDGARSPKGRRGAGRASAPAERQTRRTPTRP